MHVSYENEEYLETCLSNNFWWLLKYLASTVDARSSEVYLCLINIENSILDIDPQFFGDIYKTLRTDLLKKSKARGGIDRVQNRLC